MKTRNPIIYGAVFIIFISSCYALCFEPDIIAHKQCLDAKCGTGYAKAPGCSDPCDADFQKKLDDYTKCLEAEQKELENHADEGKEGTAKVTNIRGELKVVRKDGTTETLTSDTLIRYGDTIKTSEKGGHATVTLPDGTTLRLSPGSEFEFNSPSKKKCLNAQFVIFLKRLKTWVNHRRVNFEVRTPQACCCIRGTDFIVDYDEIKNITKVYLYDGALDIISEKDETFELNAGEMMTLDSSGNAVRAALSEGEWNSIVSSIEPEEEIAPSQATTDSEEQKTGKTPYLIGAAIIVLVLVALLAKRKRSK